MVAGNYGAVRDLLWPRADTIVWMDYSLPLVLHRLTARTYRCDFPRLFAEPAHAHARIVHFRSPRGRRGVACRNVGSRVA